MKHCWITGIMLTLAFTLHADGTCWDFRPEARHNTHWSGVENMTATPSPDGLLLTLTGADCHLVLDRPDIDPQKFQRIRIVYRAWDLPGSTRGELFFASKKAPVLDGDHYLVIPSLLADGQWHELILDGKGNIARSNAPWDDGSPVNYLRLDLVNEFPGRIELQRVECLPPAAPPVDSVSATVLEQGFLLPRELFRDNQMTVALPAGNYYLWARCGNDRTLWSQLDSLTVTPGKFTAAPRARRKWQDNWLYLGEIVCAAPAEQQFKLSNAPDSEIAGFLLTPEAKIPALRPSGVPERYSSEIVMNAGKTAVIPSPYWKSRMITAPGQQSREGASTRFRRHFTVSPDHPVTRAMLQVTADDMVEAVALNGKVFPLDRASAGDWSKVSTVDMTDAVRPGENVLALQYRNAGGYGGLLYDLALVTADGGELIAGDGSEKTLFRELPEDAAWLQNDFDDSAWGKSEIHDPPPAMPWSIALPYQAYLASRKSWEVVAVKTPENVAAADELTAELTLRATPEPEPGEPVLVTVRNARGLELDKVQRPFSDWESRKNADGSITLTLRDLPLFRYGPAIKGAVEVTLPDRGPALGGKTAAAPFAAAARPVPARPGDSLPLRAELVRSTQGDGHEIQINGRAVYPVFLSTFDGRYPVDLNDRNTPYDIRECCAGNWWIGPGEYDFSEIDWQMNMMLKQTPNTYLAAWVWCQPRHWYDEKYPDRISRDSDGGVFPYYMSTVTFSDPDYRREAEAAIQAFVRHCETYYGNRIVAYNLCGGISFEWQGWGCHSQSERKVLNDYGSSARRDFAAFVRKNYPGLPEAVPTYEARTLARETIFRDPVADHAAMAYDQYYAYSIGECIAGIAKAAKAAMKVPKLLGAYYGYQYEYAGMGFCINTAGHNALTPVLASPDIDFLVSPPSYGIRGPGEPGGDMKPFGSLAAHGKLSLIEDDIRTHLTGPMGYGQGVNAEQTRMLLRRNWGMMLARKTPILMLPLCGGNDLDSDDIRTEMKQAARAGRLMIDEPRRSGVEVAMVTDENSFRTLRTYSDIRDSREKSWVVEPDGLVWQRPRKTQYLTGNLLCYQRIPLQQFGAGVDCLLVDDVPAAAKRYKLWIFAGDFAANPGLRQALAAIRAEGGTVLVVYGAGFVTDTESVDANIMSELLGIRLERIAAGPLSTVVDNFADPVTAQIRQPVFGAEYAINPRFAVVDPQATALGRYVHGDAVSFAVKREGSYTVVFLGSETLTPDLIRSVSAAAGVPIYSNANDTFFAGYGFYTLHAGSPGVKTITFPEAVDAVDLYSGEVLGRKVNQVSREMKVFDTWSIVTGDADRILEAIKKP